MLIIDIKQDIRRRKKIWNNINKIRDKTERSEDTKVLNKQNREPLKISEVEVQIEQYWTNIYKIRRQKWHTIS